MELTDIERRMLRLLQQDGRMPNAELARRSGQSESPCLRRLRHLEESGVITGYRAVVDQKKAGYPISAFVLVDTDQRTETDRRMFLEAVLKEPSVISCAAIAGQHDFILQVVARDVDDLGDLMMTRLLGLPSVRDLSSSLVYTWIKRDEPVGV